MNITATRDFAAEQLEPRRLLADSQLTPGFIEVIDVFDDNGNQLNTNVIEIPFEGAIQVVDGSGVSLRGGAVNPISQKDKRIVVDVFNVRVKPGTNNRVLQFQTENLVTMGGQLYFYGEGIQDGNGDAIRQEPGVSRMRMPRGLDKWATTQALRQYRMYFREYASGENFSDATAPLAGTIFTDEVNREALDFVLRLRVDRGEITAQAKDEAMARFDSDFAKAVVPDASLRAGLVSLTGTIGEPAIAAMLDGENIEDRPWSVIDFSSDISDSAPIAETINDKGKIRTLIRPSLRGEFFTALGSVLAHESIHQDTGNTVNEEIVANAIETFVYAEQIKTYPIVARTETQLTKALNGRLLGLLNSGGSAVPRVGLNNAPRDTGDNVFVDDQGQQGTGFGNSLPTSFRDDVTFEYVQRRFNTGQTPLNDTVKQMLVNLNGLDSIADIEGNLFSDDIIDQIDARQTVISNQDAVFLAGRLGLVWFLV
jgi:hypothetical protein